MLQPKFCIFYINVEYAKFRLRARVGNVCKLNNRYCLNLANNWGIYVSWRVFVRPLGTRLGNIHFVIYTFVLDIYCQQLGDICKSVGGCLCALWAQG